MSQHTDEVKKTMNLLREALFPREEETDSSRLEGLLKQALADLAELKARPQYMPYAPTPPCYFHHMRVGDFPPYRLPCVSHISTDTLTFSPKVTVSGPHT